MRIEQIERTLQNHEDRIFRLENPIKFCVGDRIKFRDFSDISFWRMEYKDKRGVVVSLPQQNETRYSVLVGRRLYSVDIDAIFDK